MKFRITAFALAAIMMITMGLAGCGSNSPSQSPSPEQSSGVQAKNTVTDELGREVTIPENPQKILALTSAAMQALFNIGITPVGKVDDYKVTEEGMALPSVGTASSVNIEAVYTLQPDFIIASSRFHAALKEELEQSGAAVYYFDPDKVGDIPVVEVTAYIGKLLNKEDVAEQYVQSVYTAANELKEKIASKTDIKTGIVIQDGDTIVAAQNASSYGSMLTLLGIDNIVPDNLPNAKKSSFVPFDVETIIASNPDLVFIMTPSKDAENNKAILKKFKSDSQWAALDAAKKNQLLILPFSVNPNRSTPEMMVKATAEAVLKTAK
ncbi:ABC transporter substrate-binding protein [Desulfoscipio sp. XC116]|uniref:ABC transporter substrate-binding protein n=1 Tax=Desulfoscipio sp. XC116 TaxID=3144975 RepID=UPI00325B42E9